MTYATPPRLLVGPVLRFVDQEQAVIWVETDRRCVVEILGTFAPTWCVHGHHYALICLEGLEPGTTTPYEVRLDGVRAWPDPASPYPPSTIRTPSPGTPYRLAFGSCRKSAPFDRAHLDKLGADALAALAERFAANDGGDRLDMLLMVGDQVYADEPSDQIVRRITARHPDDESEVAAEAHDYEEYTWLYHESWTPPSVRWLLSTVPSCMLLDDHDLRDDWNTSRSWRRRVTQQSWWRDRVVGALGSYWVYQHLGNLSPLELRDDELYQQMLSIDDDDERTRALDQFAWRADAEPDTARWSFHRDLGGTAHRIRLIAIDSRCSRHLDPDDRRIVDADEWRWVTERATEVNGQVDHLVLASTLPFLLLDGIHHLEGWNEAMSSGAWGRLGKAVGERMRQLVDLEHWAAFRSSLAEFVSLLDDVVRADRPPSTVLLLSGDVHCSYHVEARLSGRQHPATRIHQLTMSPFRNGMERIVRWSDTLVPYRPVTRVMRTLARRAGVQDLDIDWRTQGGLWFDNGIMIIELSNTSASAVVEHATHEQGKQQLSKTMAVDLGPSWSSVEPAPSRPSPMDCGRA